ncbi:MAG: NUDIX hydrolase [Gemmatimonadaceae bacterium]
MNDGGGDRTAGLWGGAPDVHRLLAPPRLTRLAHSLLDRPGALADAEAEVRRAAVALVLRAGAGGGLDLLFIERSVYPGDPWSGQVAFPGGRRESFDDTLRETAVRETREELGFDLEREGVILGTLDEIYPRTPVLPPIVVRPYVAVVAPEVPMLLSEEVAGAFWVPLDVLHDPGSSVEATVHVRGADRLVPSLRHERYTIWGMTERICRNFLAVIDG